MHLTISAAESAVKDVLEARGMTTAAATAWATVWLEACGYSGVTSLAEALGDERRTLDLTRDALGLDLDNVSCAFLAPAIMRDISANGRAFLRNVRHGLFLLPFAVRANIGIGCPVDPGFALGGERHKNPYGEKLALAEANGIDIDGTLWNNLKDRT